MKNLINISNIKLINVFKIILIFFIFIIGLVIRFTDLGLNPNGLTNDEADIGYDAYSILKTGKDQWGEGQPNTYLKGFGDYRPPIYTYTVIPAVAVFGLNEFAVRFPSAISGGLTVLVVFFLTLIIFNNFYIALIAMFLLCINPWHIAMSRVGIESTMAVLFVSTATLLLLKSISEKIWLFPAVFIFALSIYTYTANIIFTPLLFIALIIFFRNKMLENKKLFISSLVLFFFCMLPLINGGIMKTASARSTQVSFLNDSGIITSVNAKRGECQIDYEATICKIFQNKYAAYGITYINNYLHHFSPEIMMINGTPTQYSVLPERGLLYIVEYLAFIFGLYFLFTGKQKFGFILLAWVFISPLADSITGNGHYSRFLDILPSVQIVAAYGLYRLWQLFGRWQAGLFLIIPIILFESVSFSTVYWSYFPRFYATFSQFGYKDLFNFIDDHKDKYDAIIISNRINDTKQYIYYLFYSKYDPIRYQIGNDIEREVEKGGWIRIRRIGKIYFLPSIAMPLLHVSDASVFLFAGAPSEFKANGFYTIYDPKHNPVFTLTQSTGADYNLDAKNR